MKKLSNVHLQKKLYRFKRVIGTSTRPRLSIFRSHKHIYTQLVDDLTHNTVVSSSTLESSTKYYAKVYLNYNLSFYVGEILAKKSLIKNIKTIIFDKKNLRYHGRIKYLVEGIKKYGLKFSER